MSTLSTPRLRESLTTPRAALVILTLASLAFALLHAGPLNGGLIALVLTIGLQLILPGVVLTRALGLLRREEHPLVNLTWVLTGGLGLTIVLGGLARLLLIPVAAYELILHGLLIGLILLPPRPAADAEAAAPWRFTRAALPWLALLIVACAVSAAGGYERARIRFSGFADQTVFVSLTNWLAHDPSDPGLLSLRVGRVQGDIRWATDGWTYTQAAWAWSSGRPPADIIWHDVTPLFAWLIPLIWFGLAYRLTGRDRVAAFTAAAVVIYGLLTVDDLFYNTGTGVFGQDGLFELSTLRKFSTGVALPLTLSALVAVLDPRRATIRRAIPWTRLLLLALIGVALAMLHPQQVTMFLVDAVAVTAVWWLAAPNRLRLRRALAVAGAIGIILVLPLVQWKLDPIRSVSATAQINANLTAETGDSASSTPETSNETPDGVRVTAVKASTGTALLTLDGLPLLGSTYILDPTRILIHPLVLLAVGLGLLAGIGWRRSPAAGFVFAATAAPLAIVLTPGLTPLFARFATLATAARLLLAVPVALTLGLALDALLARFPARLSRSALDAGASLLLIVAIGLLYLEPLPILPASGRDQIRAASEIETLRAMQPADVAVIARLVTLVPTDRDSIVVADARISGYIIENVPHTLITGGRESGNITYPATARFFTETAPIAPWLDAADVTFLRETGVTHVILQADDTRLTQVLLQPERFPPLDAVDGYLIFGVGDLAPHPEDDLFAAMNGLYAGLDTPRWGPDGFVLVRPGSQALWAALAEQWETRLAAAPEGDAARLGLAFTHLLAGADADALPLWQALHAAHPADALIARALAATQARLDDPAAGRDTLLAQLDAPETGPRLLAARDLLSADFLYLLDDPQLDHALTVIAAAPDAWHLLAEWDRWLEVRQRAALLISRNRLAEAAATLDALPIPERGPDDLVTNAMLRLMQGDPPAALAALAPANDPDRIASGIFLHPDRWADNRAAQFYAILAGNLAERDGDLTAAIAAYRRAVAAGSEWTGPAFLADVLDAAGQSEEAAALRADRQTAWWAENHTDFPQLSSVLDLDPAHPYASHLTVAVDDAAHTLTLNLDLTSHPGAYPVSEWRIVAASPDAATQYAADRLPADWVESALTHVTTTLSPPADLPELTPIRVFVQPQYDDRVTYPATSADVIANPPASAAIPPEAIPLDVTFADGIRLHAALIQQEGASATLTLYWEADAAVSRDYQVFVHALDAAGEPLQQADSAPLDGRYPTGQWRAGRVIADPHPLTLPEGSTPARFYVGLYALPEAVRLPVLDAPPAVEVVSDGIMIPVGAGS